MSDRSIGGIATSIAIVVIIAAAPAARAQNADAEALFADGNRLMQAGKLAEACDAYEASNRIEARAGTLIRLGECREQNHQLASAWSAYKDALNRVKDPHKRDVATARVAALESRLSQLTIAVPDATRIAGLVVTRNHLPVDPALWNRALPFDGGDYEVTADAPGRRSWHATVHVPIELGQVRVEVPVPELPAPLESAPPIVQVKPGDASPVEESPPLLTTSRIIAIGAGGLAVASVVVAALVGKSAHTKQNDAFRLCPDPATPCDRADDANALIHTSHTRSLEANIGFGIAAAAAAAGAVLWFVVPGADQADRVGVVPTASPTSAGLSLVGSF